MSFNTPSAMSYAELDAFLNKNATPNGYTIELLRRVKEFEGRLAGALSGAFLGTVLSQALGGNGDTAILEAVTAIAEDFRDTFKLAVDDA